MKIPLVNLETLRKFNSGSNAKAFDNDLEPGTYPVCMTVTIKGDLAKGNPGVTRSRNTTGAANIVRYLLTASTTSPSCVSNATSPTSAKASST